jgi:lysophospholipase L1-like esterase
LVVGDSVAFGLGVNDSDTLPSQMQRELVDDYQVVNGALSGFGTTNNLKMIDLFSDEPVDHLVFVICANDVLDRGPLRGTLEIMEALARVRKRFETITVVLHQYLYEILPRFFYPRERERLELQMLELNRETSARARELGMTFINWHDVAAAHMSAARTEFAGFSLYTDHCHFSPLGNRLLAAAILDQSIRKN